MPEYYIRIRKDYIPFIIICFVVIGMFLGLILFIPNIIKLNLYFFLMLFGVLFVLVALIGMLRNNKRYFDNISSRKKVILSPSGTGKSVIYETIELLKELEEINLSTIKNRLKMDSETAQKYINQCLELGIIKKKREKDNYKLN